MEQYLDAMMWYKCLITSKQLITSFQKRAKKDQVGSQTWLVTNWDG